MERDPQQPAVDDAAEELTRYFVAEYLCNSGLTWASVNVLPEADNKRVLSEASVYASSRLGEIRNKRAFLQMLHSN